MGVGGSRHALTALPPVKRPRVRYTGGCVGHKTGLEG